jgi:3-hydroxybutyryl-CoA dehydratase
MTQPVPVGHRLAPLEKSVTQDQVAAYANATGDFNPIHLDSEYAAQTQFGRRIAHGMLVLAFVSEMMATAFPREWPSAGRVKVRFRAPVYPGETVKVTGEAVAVKEAGSGGDGAREIEFRVAVVKPDGSEAVSGQAFVRLSAGPS